MQNLNSNLNKNLNSNSNLLDENLLEKLKNKKNLLAFSYGSDSAALFFLLKNAKIDFDLAFINYKIREQSELEEAAARALASKFEKQIFIKCAPKFNKNFENAARVFRYEFFDELCKEFKYENLILAHHLNDKFEWFLMQLSRGAGLIELLGMKGFEKRQNYNLIRPLINTSKDEISAFLEREKIHFFKDESNENQKYFRNFIRHNFANDFVSKFEKGLKKSFEFLGNDLNEFTSFEFKEFQNILISPKNGSLIAKCVKKFGVVMSEKQRQNALKKDCVISHKIGICYFKNFALIFLCEKMKEKMPKSFKEECRIAKIPPLIRFYLFKNNIKIKDFLENFE